MTHELKTWPEFYTAILNRSKTFEARKDDRGFTIGDALLLREFDPERGYTERQTLKNVSYILRGPNFGVQDGYCIMALAEPNMHDTPEYQQFVAESAEHCHCCEECERERPCAGVLAGGMCDQACVCHEAPDEHHWNAPRDFGDD